MALDLDGNNDRIEAPLPSVFNTISNSDITVEFVARIDDLRSFGTWTRLFDATFDNKNFIQFNVPNNNRVQFTVEDNNTQRGVRSDANLVEGVWYHFAGVWHAASNTVEFFINGQSQSGGQSGGAGDGKAASLGLGFRTDNQGHMDGALDEVRIWNVARTQAEILANKDNALTGDEANLAAYWSFDEGQGVGSYDWSDNGMNATLINMNPATDWIDSGLPVAENSMTNKIGVLEEGQRLIQLVGATDVDNNDATLGYRISTLPTNGVLYQYNAGAKGAVISAGDLLTDASGRLFWEPNLHYVGSDTVQFKANDGALDSIAAATINLTVDAVNDAPVNTVPAAQTLAEDALLTFSTANGTAIVVDDVDGANVILEVQLKAKKGVVTLSQTTGLVFSQGDGVADKDMTFTGTQAAINAALQGAGFQPDSEFSGAASLTIITNDLGNIGAGSALSDTDVITITVVPSADLPRVTPTTATTNEDTQTAGFRIQRSTLDGGEVKFFKITNIIGGTLYQSDGVSPINAGDFITIAQGNAKLLFTPGANLNSSMPGPLFGFDITASLIAADAGLGADVASVAITVDAVNDAPVNTVPLAQILAEDTALVFSTANGNALRVSDDASDDGSPIATTVTVSKGVLTVAMGSGATVTNNGTTSVVITGTVGQVNAELQGLIYQPDAIFFGADTLQINTNDLGNTGIGAALSDTDSVLLTITPMADTPSITAATTNEDIQTTTGLVISRHITDGAEVGFFKITNLTGGILYRNDGTTLINEATFISFADANAGLFFTPTANLNSGAGDLFGFDVQASLSATDAGLGGVSVAAQITVLGVNDPPLLTAGSAQIFMENDPDLLLDNTITVTDVDHANLTSATVSISGGFQSGADRLNGVDANGITAVWNGVTGVLTLSGSASLANYQTALRAVTYGNASESPTAGLRTIRYRVNDGIEESLAVTSTVTVTSVIDPPSVIAGAALTFTEGDAATAVDTTLTVADLDDSNLEFATVTVSGGYLASEDRLAFNTALGITGAWNGATGVLTLSGSASKANYQTALRSITYENTAGDNPTAGVRSLSFVVNDGDVDSAASTATVTVVAVNDRPLLTAGAAVVVSEGDGPTLLDVTLTSSDADDINLEAAVVAITSGFISGEDQLFLSSANGISGIWNGAAGLLTLSGSASLANYQAALRSITYSNLAGDAPTAGIRTLSYVANDGALDSLAVTSTLTMLAVDDVPIVTAGALLTVVEGDPATVMDATVTLTDGDDINLEGASVRLGAGFVAGEDQLGFTNTAALSGVWNAATGVLTLSGTATLADYQTALRSVTYVNAAGDGPTAGVRSIEWRVNDGDFNSAVVTSTINVTKVNDLPVLAAGGSLVYTEGEGATVLDAGITAVDVDHVLLQRATVSLSAGYRMGEDRLSFVNANGITGLWDSATGVLILSGASSVVNYQSALQSVRYANDAGDNPSAGVRTVQLVVDDGDDESVVVTSTVTVLPVNDAPSVVAGAVITFSENAATTLVDTGIVVTDPDSSTLTSATVTIAAGYVGGEDVLTFIDANGITAVWNGAAVLSLSGTATLADYQTALRSVRYANTAGDIPTSGVRTLSFVVNDGIISSSSSGSTITVTAVNDAPVLTVPAAQTLLEDTNLSLSGVSLQDGDVGAGNMTVSLSVNNGTLTLASTTGLSFATGDGTADPLLIFSGELATLNSVLNTLTYRGNLHYNGADLLSIAVSDQGNSGSGGNQSATATVALTLTPVQDVPSAGVDGLTTPEDVSRVISIANDLLINDNDPDGDILTLTSFTLPSHGVLVDNGNATLTYTPDLNYNGADSFVYTVSDGQGNSQNAVVTIVVEPIPDALNATPDTLGLDEDILTTSGNFLSNDWDPDYHVALVDFGQNPALAIIGFTPASSGVLVYNGNGTFTYTPNADFFGTDGFSYTLNAGDARIDIGTVTLTIAAINDAPTWSVNSGSVVNEGATIVIHNATLQVSDREQNALSLTYTLGATPTEGTLQKSGIPVPLGGTFTQDDLDNNRLTYSHSGSETIADSFGVTVSDGVGGVLPLTAIFITVNPLNDSPILLTNSGVALNEAASVTIGNGVLKINDADNTPAQIRLTVTELPANGLLQNSGVSLVLNDTLTQDDIDNGLVRYLHNGSETLGDGFRFTVADGAGGAIAEQRFALTINPVNDAPVLVTNSGVTLNEGESRLLDSTLLSSSDADNSAADLVYRLTVLPDHGQLTLNAIPLGVAATFSQDDLNNSRLLYRHDGSETVSDLFKVTLTDGVGGTVGETPFTITLLPVNDAPFVVAGALLTYNENDPATVVDGTITLSDADNVSLQSAVVTLSGGYLVGEDQLQFNDTATITGSWTAGTGVLTLSGVATLADYQAALRSVTYNNLSGDNPTPGNRSLNFVVHDGSASSIPATSTITVVAVNDRPVLTAGNGWVYTENDAATPLDDTLTLTDPDDATMESATVTLSAGYVAGQDILGFVDSGSLVGAWNAGSGVLTITGTASMADYQSALRRVTYVNSDGDHPTAGTRTLAFLVNDGASISSAVTSQVIVNPVDDPPVVTAGGLLTFTENNPAQVIDAAITVTDVDDTHLESAILTMSSGYDTGKDRLAWSSSGGITGTWNSASGVLILSGAATLAEYQTALRNVTFVNDSDNPLAGDRLVQIQTNDGDRESLPVTATVRLLAVNDRPTSQGLVNILFTEGDADARLMEGVVVGDPDNAQLQKAVVAITSGYVAAEDRLLFVDANGISGSWDGGVGVLTLNGPASVADYETALRTLTYHTLNSDNPSAGVRTLGLTLMDGSSSSLVDSFQLTVTAVNDAPQRIPGAGLVYSEGDGTVKVDPGMVLTDPDDTTLQSASVQISSGYQSAEDRLAFAGFGTIMTVWDAGSGILTLSGAATVADYQFALRSITYQNTAGDNPIAGSRTLIYRVDDGKNSSLDIHGSIAVIAVNDAPVMTAGNLITYSENDPAKVIDASLTVIDGDHGVLSGATVDFSAGFVAGEDLLGLINTGSISGSWDAVAGALTLTGNATPAAYQTALASVTYVNSNPDTPVAGSRNVRFVVRDGMADSLPVTSTVVVTAVNDRPVVTAGGAYVYTEGASSGAVDSGIVVIDVDNTPLDHATIAFDSGYHTGEDRLDFIDTGTILGSWSGTDGILTLSGVATVAEYQAALRSVNYTNLAGDNPNTDVRIVSFSVNDGSAESWLDTASVHVVAVNDRPVLTSTGTLAYTENAPATVIDAFIGVTDADNSLLEAATMTVSGPLSGEEDLLGFVNVAGITGVWDAVGQQITLTGTATVAAYQTALRSVTYIHTNGDDPTPGSRTIDIQVYDGAVWSQAVSATVEVTAVNDAPQITVPGLQNGTEDINLVIAGLSINDVDVEKEAGTLSVAVAVSEGIVTLGATSGLTFTSGADATASMVFSGSLTDVNAALNSVTYRGGSNYAGHDTLLLSVSDQGGSGVGGAKVDAQSVAIVLAPVQDTPVSGGDVVLVTDEDTSVVISIATDILSNDSDVDGDPLSASGFTATLHGSLVNNLDGTLTYTPDLHYHGLDGFNYTLSDGQGGLDIGTVILVVNPVEDGLSTVDDTVAVIEDISVVSANLIANDWDPDYQVGQADFGLNPALAIIGFTQASNGVAVYNGAGQFSYQPNGNFFGTDQLTYTLNAGDARIGKGIVTFNVAPVNDAPVWVNNTGLTVAEAGSVLLDNAAMKVTDVEQTPAELLFMVDAVPTSGFLLKNGAVLLAVGDSFSQDDIDQSRIVYTHDGTETFTDSVVVSVTDGAGITLFPATVTLTITPLNDAPVLLVNNGASLPEGDSVTLGHTLLRVTDVDNSAAQLRFSLTTLPTHGTVSNNGIALALGDGFTQKNSDDSLVLYQHDGSETTDDFFNFTVSDGAGGAITVTPFTLAITPVNDAPLLTTHRPLSLNEGETAVIGNDRLFVSDAEQNTAQRQYRLTQLASGGVLRFNNQDLLLNATFTQADIDANLLSYRHFGGESPSDGFRFTVSDGAGGTVGETLFDIGINPRNDAPQATAGATLTYTENGSATAIDTTVLVSDVDNTTLQGALIRIQAGFVSGEDSLSFVNVGSISGVWNGATGALNLSGSATVAQYQAALRSVAYHNSSDNPSVADRTVAFVVNDGSAVSSAVTSTVRVVAVNDAPLVTAGGLFNFTENSLAQGVDGGITVADVDNSHLEGATIIIGSGYDAGNESLSLTNTGRIIAAWDGANGLLTLQGTATLAEYQSALRSITYVNTSDNPLLADRLVSIIINDGAATSPSATATIRMTAVNDKPLLSGLSNGLYTEGDISLLLATGAVVRDVDDGQLQGATVAITDGFMIAEDQLLFVDANGITGSWDGVTGILTLNGAATLASYQAALHTLTYVNQGSDNPTPGNRTLTMTVHDGDLASTAATFTVTVQGVNDVPQLLLGAPLSYTEGDGVVVLDSAFTLSDPDTLFLHHATVQIGSGYQSGEDLLALVNRPAIQVSWDPSLAVLNLTGVASLAEYQSAFRAITYENRAGNNPTSGNRTLIYQANDGTNDSLTDTGHITVTAVNDAPVMHAGAIRVYTENDPALVVDATVTVVDDDTAILVGAVVDFAAGYALGEDRLVFTDAGNISGVWDGASGKLTLTGLSTPSAYAAALSHVGYFNNNPDTPVEGDRTLRFWVNDGSANSIPVTSTVTVVAVNDRPVVSAGDPLVFTEGDSAGVVDAGITLVDVDDSHLDHARLVFNAGYHAGQDQLNFIDTGTILGAWDSINGVLTLSGSAPSADYQAALRSVTYSNLSGDDPSIDLRTLSLTVNDGERESVAAPVTVQVVAVNDRPVATAGGTLVYRENASPLAVDGFITLTDADDSLLEGATLTLSGVLVSAEDRLGFNTISGISGVWNDVNKQMTLSGTASVSAYQTALRSVYYENTNGNDPTPGSRSMVFWVNDGEAQSLPATANIVVTAVNDAPIITTPGAQSAVEDIPFSLSGLHIEDVDVEKEGGVVSVALTVTYGTLTLASQQGLTLAGGGNGQSALVFRGSLGDINRAINSLTYLGHANFFGNDSLLVQANDQGGSGEGGIQVDAKTVAISVAAIQDAPVSGGDVVLMTDEDLSIVIPISTALLANDSDVDGDSLTASGFTSTSHGLLINNQDGTLTYTPHLNFNGVDGFQYTVSDGQGGSDFGRVVIIVNPVEDALVAGHDTVFLWEDQAVTTVNLLANDRDPDYHVDLADFGLNPNLAIISFTQTVHGIAVYNEDGTFTYTPNAHYFGEDTLVYTLHAGDNRIGHGVVTLTVGPGNDAPQLIRNVGATLAEGQAVVVDNTLLQVTDIEQGAGHLLYTLNSVPAYGSLHNQGVLLAVGDSFSQDDIDQNRVGYGHDGSETTQDRFVFSVSDGAGATLFPTAFVLTITPINDAPVLYINAGATVQEAGDTTINAALLWVADVDNTPDQLSFTVLHPPAHGMLLWDNNPWLGGSFTQADINNSRLGYRHDGSETLEDSFDFTVSDGAGGIIPLTPFILAVSGINDAPMVLVNRPQTVDEGATVMLDNSFLRMTDTEQGSTALRYRLTQLPSHGVLSVNGQNRGLNESFTQADIDTGLLKYAHDGGETVADSFRFIGADGAGGLTEETVFYLVITPINDAPVVTVVGGLSFTENQTAKVLLDQLTLSDADDSTLAWATVSLAADFLPGEDYLTLTPTGTIIGSWNENTGLLTLSGTASLSDYQKALRSVTYDNRAGDDPTSGRRAVSIVVDDGKAESPAAHSFVTITAVNDRPVVTAGAVLAYSEGDGPRFVDTTLTLQDGDNATLSGATVVLNHNGHPAQEEQLLFSPIHGISGVWSTGKQTLFLTGQASVAHYQEALRRVAFVNSNVDNPTPGSHTVTFTVQDGLATSLPVTSRVDVTAVNDAPEITAPDQQNTMEEVELSLAGLFVRDVDAGDNPIRLNLRVDHGTLKLASLAGLAVESGKNGGSVLSVTGTTTAIHAALNGLRYQGAVDFNGIDRLLLQANDLGHWGSGGSAGSEKSLIITVHPVEDQPIAGRDLLLTAEDTPLVFNVAQALLANDSDGDGDLLSLSGFTLPVHGVLTDLGNGNMRYLPDSNFNGLDGFTYTVVDGHGGRSQAEVSIVVDPVMDSLRINPDFARTDEDIRLITPSVLVNDRDPDFLPTGKNPALKVVGFTTADHGRVVYNDDGTFTYTPQADFFGTDHFSYSAMVAQGDDDRRVGRAIVTIEVDSINDLPVLTHSGLTVLEGGQTAVSTALLRAVDVEQGTTALVFTLVSLPDHGSLLKNSQVLTIGQRFSQADVDAGRLIYQHDGSELPHDAFKFSLSDGASPQAEIGTLKITVIAVNDNPILVKDPPIVLFIPPTPPLFPTDFVSVSSRTPTVFSGRPPFYALPPILMVMRQQERTMDLMDSPTPLLTVVKNSNPGVVDGNMVTPVLTAVQNSLITVAPGGLHTPVLTSIISSNSEDISPILSGFSSGFAVKAGWLYFGTSFDWPPGHTLSQPDAPVKEIPSEKPIVPETESKTQEQSLYAQIRRVDSRRLWEADDLLALLDGLKTHGMNTSPERPLSFS